MSFSSSPFTRHFAKMRLHFKTDLPVLYDHFHRAHGREFMDVKTFFIRHVSPEESIADCLNNWISRLHSYRQLGCCFRGCFCLRSEFGFFVPTQSSVRIMCQGCLTQYTSIIFICSLLHEIYMLIYCFA